MLVVCGWCAVGVYLLGSLAWIGALLPRIDALLPRIDALSGIVSFN